MRSFIRLGNWPNLAQFVTRLIVGPVVSGRSRRGRSSWRPHRRYSQVFRPTGTPAFAHPSGRRVMAAPLTTEHREILHQRSPVKAEAEFRRSGGQSSPRGRSHGRTPLLEPGALRTWCAGGGRPRHRRHSEALYRASLYCDHDDTRIAQNTSHILPMAPSEQMHRSDYRVAMGHGFKQIADTFVGLWAIGPEAILQLIGELLLQICCRCNNEGETVQFVIVVN